MYSLLFLAALPGQFVESDLFSKARQQAAFEATVRIYHDPSRSAGSAVIVGRRDGLIYLLTAAHLVPEKAIAGREKEDLKKVEIALFTVVGRDQPPKQAIATVIARMPNEDLAVLTAIVPNHAGIVPICPNDREKLKFQLPMTVMTVGAELDALPEIRIDVVRDKKLIDKPDQTRAFHWEADIPQPMGRSGGPMIDARGYVIGIASGTQHKRGYYVAIGEIIAALHGEGLDWLTEKPAVKK
jgi:S1-C subfamily serine protease